MSTIQTLAEQTAPLLAEALRLADQPTREKLDTLLASGGRVGVAVYVDRDGRHFVDLVGAELEGRRILCGAIS